MTVNPDADLTEAIFDRFSIATLELGDREGRFEMVGILLSDVTWLPACTMIGTCDRSFWEREKTFTFNLVKTKGVFRKERERKRKEEKERERKEEKKKGREERKRERKKERKKKRERERKRRRKEEKKERKEEKERKKER
ncbi:hypothetical protein L345_06593, partial [Ophiophagus hannah]